MAEGQISESLKGILGSNTRDFRTAGIWAGGIVAIVSRPSKLPGLFFQTLDEPASIDKTSLSVQGLSISRQYLSVNEENVSGLLLEPKDNDFVEPFFALADHLFDHLSFQTNVSGNSLEIFDLIDDWIEFWKTNLRKPSREMLLGLIGELLTITRLLGDQGLGHLNWEGPAGGNHDFRAGGNAIEVKACGSRAGGLIHRISSQRQLEIPESGSLHVHSLRLQIGANLSHRLDDLISEASHHQMFASPDGKRHFEKSVGAIIATGEIPEELATFDLLEQHLFRVDADFPRINANELMVGVIDVKYSIDLTSLVTDETSVKSRTFDLMGAKWRDQDVSE